MKRCLAILAALFLAWTAWILSFVPRAALATTITNPSQLWVTVSNGVKITLAQYVDGVPRPVIAFGTTCNAATIQTALNQGASIILPVGTCDLSTTGLTMAQFSQLVGQGPEQSIVTYSGTGCGITLDSVNSTLLEGFRLSSSGSGASVRGLCYSNTTANALRNVARNVQVWSSQNPPVVGQYGVYIHSTTANSLYYNEFDHVDVNLWDKGFYSLGDIGFGGANANKWFAPEVNACTTGMDFQGVAGANFVYGLHCNGSGVAIDQTCVNIGDGVNNSAGNFIEVYTDNSVSGHVGKTYTIAATSSKNRIFSYSSSTLGTNANNSTTDRNWTVELNGASGRNTFSLGNIVLSADTSPTINLLPVTGAGNMGILQVNVSNSANATVFRVRGNATLTGSGAVVQEFFNAVRVNAIDLNGAMQQTGQTFANLGSPATPPNGTIQYCSDCTIANPCAGGGTGAFAKRLNGVWVCN